MSRDKPIAEAATTSLLVGRLSRSQLEQLVVAAVASGETIKKQALLDLLPGGTHSTSLSVSLADTHEREGTGKFDWLGIELLTIILSKVPLQSRLDCSLAVCKSWRVLQRIESLWTQIAVGETWTDSFEKFCSHPEDPLPISSGGLVRLMDWLPVAAVRTFVIHAGDKTVAPETLKKALAAMKSLTAVRLQGKKVTAACVKHLVKQPYIANLVELQLGPSVKASLNDKLLVLAKARSLTHLTMHFEEDSNDTFCSSLVRTLREARGPGTTPLLTHLTLSDYSGGCCTWRSLHDIGRGLPELEGLTLGGVVFPDRHVVTQLQSLWQPLVRLRSLEIRSLLGYDAPHEYLTTEYAGQVLRAILAAAPQLEDLSIRHGASGSLSSNTWPGADGALVGLPATLTRLCLLDFHLEPGAFDGCSLPRLRQLRLGNCGGCVEPFVLKLEGDCPLLRPENIAYSETGPTRMPAGYHQLGNHVRDPTLAETRAHAAAH